MPHPQPNQVDIMASKQCCGMDAFPPQGPPPGLQAFISPQEYSDAINKVQGILDSEFNTACALCLLPGILTCGVSCIFLACYACCRGDTVTKQIDGEILQPWTAKGLGVSFICGDKHTPCRIRVTLPAGFQQSAPGPVMMGAHAARTMQVLVPPGAAAGTTLQVQAPDGTTIQVVVPAGAAAGSQFTVQY